MGNRPRLEYPYDTTGALLEFLEMLGVIELDLPELGLGRYGLTVIGINLK